jgi:hypothetical protein
VASTHRCFAYVASFRKNGLPRTKKDCETIESDVFAIPGLPLAHFSTAESGFNLACPERVEGFKPFNRVLRRRSGRALRSRCLRKHEFQLFQMFQSFQTFVVLQRSEGSQSTCLAKKSYTLYSDHREETRFCVPVCRMTVNNAGRCHNYNRSH